MGSQQSLPDPAVTATAVPLVQAFLDARSPNTYFTHKSPPCLRHYVECCAAHSAVVFPDIRDFEDECKANAAIIHMHCIRKGMTRFVHRGIYYAVMHGTEGKLFQQHMKSLRYIRFLAIPGVVVPDTAVLSILGIRVACIQLLHLFRPVTTPANSRHASVVRTILSKSLRIPSDPAVIFYEGGNGTLIVVDATAMLPQACILPSRDYHWHCFQPELLIGRDLGELSLSSAQLAPPTDTSNNIAFDSPQQRQMPQPSPSASSYLALVIAAAGGKKRQQTMVPTLQALIAISPPPVVYHFDERLMVTSSPVAQPELSIVEVKHDARFSANLPLTEYLFTHIVPSFATVLDTLPQEAPHDQFLEALHAAGLGVHLLGAVWMYTSKTRPVGRVRVATEMVSRSAKRWLQQSLMVTDASGSVDVEAVVLALIRGLADQQFIVQELHPLIAVMFGSFVTSAGIAPTGADLPFKVLLERTQQLTGVKISLGKLESVHPICRSVQRSFVLNLADESAVCSAAMKRTDGFAGASIFSAASSWSKNARRVQKIVDQLHQRVAAVKTPTEGSAATHMFLTLLQIKLTELLYEVAGPPAACDYIRRHLPDMIVGAGGESLHDRMLLTISALQCVESVLRDHSEKTVAAGLLRQVLQLVPFNDNTSYHVVASRDLLDYLYRVSVDVCLATRQMDEALLVATRWAKLCPTVFGSGSKQNCKALKMLFSVIPVTRNRREIVRVAMAQLAACETAFGNFSLRTAQALSDVGSATWKRSPAVGLLYFQRSLDMNKKVGGPRHRGVVTSLYNCALTLTRLNRFKQALALLRTAKEMALELGESATARMCISSEGTVRGVAALKIQRWFRENMYGHAKSQTTRSQTDVTTLCSTLSWSDDKNEIASSDGLLGT